MTPTRSNPTRPRWDSKSNSPIEAHAPYNFVPLPERVVTISRPPTADQYHADAMSCWLDIELVTLAPLFVRGMMTSEQFPLLAEKGSENLTPDEKISLANHFERNNRPALPGSSLRGALRALIEVAGYGRITRVGAKPTFSYRAVAAQRDDPLAQSYVSEFGRLGSNVRAGYLKKGATNDSWQIIPAKRPESISALSGSKAAFLKVKETRVSSQGIVGFKRLAGGDYKPGWYQVTFDAHMAQSRSGREAFVDNVASEKTRLPYRGVLICSGNMAETGKRKDIRSRRTSHTVILERDTVAPLPIPAQVVADYLAGLTTFQKEELGAWTTDKNGCLGDGAPVFYIERGQEVAHIGHSPNFRIPMRLVGEKRAATPLDFVPLHLREGQEPDIAQAMFGWVEGKESPSGSMASRVFVEDAICANADASVWLSEQPITPHVLSGPKPTTFQHYLVQDKGLGHDPDEKSKLAHYGTAPAETQIRGFKRYWHKGATPDILASESERALESQLTRIRPVRAGVSFKGRIHLENVRPVELGAMLWALTLPGEQNRTYAHSLGMGKPLGMGAVQIKVRNLFVLDRSKRYQSVLSSTSWHQAVETQQGGDYIEAFERHVLDNCGGSAEGAKHLYELDRIRQLFAMLEWPGPDPERTRYMEIEHVMRGDTQNEYRDRPVLPDPLAVLSTSRGIQPRWVPPITVQPQVTLGQQANPKETGQVLSFGLGPHKSFGFIRADLDAAELFVHVEKLEPGTPRLTPGDRVSFRRIPAARGVQAANVEVLS